MSPLPRRVLPLAGAAALVLALTAPAEAQRSCYVATIDQSQEVPPTGSPATGRGVFVLDRANLRLYYHITFSGLTSAETLAHIHQAPPGVNGGIVFNLGTGNPKTGVWNYPAAMDASLASGGMYVNIHSMNFMAGEIRGQILPDQGSMECMFATIDGLQEVPPNASPGTGEGFFAIDTATNNVNFFITFSGLTSAEINAHIHGFAPPGMNAGIQLPLALGSPKIGVWNYSEPDEASILGGLSYVNIHSVNFMGGEIRGQILRVENQFTYCTGKTNSVGCVPFISAAGTPSVSSTGPFTLIGDDHVVNESGFVIYSFKKSNLNFHGGKLCVKAPITRTGAKAAKTIVGGGCLGADAGRLTRNFNTTIQSGNDPLLTVGQRVFAQWRQRDPADPAGFGDNLTDGVSFVIEP